MSHSTAQQADDCYQDHLQPLKQATDLPVESCGVCKTGQTKRAKIDQAVAPLKGLCTYSLLSEVRPDSPAALHWDSLGSQLVDLDIITHVPCGACQTKAMAMKIYHFVDFVVKAIDNGDEKYGWEIIPTGSYPLNVKVGDIDEFDFLLVSANKCLQERSQKNARTWSPTTEKSDLYNRLLDLLAPLQNDELPTDGEVCLRKLFMHTRGPGVCLLLQWLCQNGHQHEAGIDLTSVWLNDAVTTKDYISAKYSEFGGTVFDTILEDETRFPLPYPLRLHNTNRGYDYLPMDPLLFEICDKVSPNVRTVYRLFKLIRELFYPKVFKSDQVTSQVLSSHDIKQLLYWEVLENRNAGEWTIDCFSKRLSSMLERIIDSGENRMRVLFPQDVIGPKPETSYVKFDPLIRDLSCRLLQVLRRSCQGHPQYPEESLVDIHGSVFLHDMDRNNKRKPKVHIISRSALDSLVKMGYTRSYSHPRHLPSYPLLTHFPILQAIMHAVEEIYREQPGMDLPTYAKNDPDLEFLLWWMYQDLKVDEITHLNASDYCLMLKRLQGYLAQAHCPLLKFCKVSDNSLPPCNTEYLKWPDIKHVEVDFVEALRAVAPHNWEKDFGELSEVYEEHCGTIYAAVNLLMDMTFINNLPAGEHLGVLWWLYKINKVITRDEIVAGTFKKKLEIINRCLLKTGCSKRVLVSVYCNEDEFQCQDWRSLDDVEADATKNLQNCAQLGELETAGIRQQEYRESCQILTTALGILLDLEFSRVATTLGISNIGLLWWLLKGSQLVSLETIKNKSTQQVFDNLAEHLHEAKLHCNMLHRLWNHGKYVMGSRNVKDILPATQKTISDMLSVERFERLSQILKDITSMDYKRSFDHWNNSKLDYALIVLILKFTFKEAES